MKPNYACCRDEHFVVHFMPVGWWAGGVWREGELRYAYAVVWMMLLLDMRYVLGVG